MRRREILKLIAASAGASAVPSFAWPQQRPAATSSASDVFSRYRIGVSYYPEQWPPAQVKEDFAKMRALGINMVRMGEFAWSSLQPSPADFRFDWLDHAIEVAAQNDVAVILGTPTASVPPWLYSLHPDVLSGNEKGPYTYGGRKGFSLDSPAMRSAATAIITRLAARYGGNPAVVGWQLSNEPGYPMVNYDPNALRAFRQWLKAQYGTLDKLNAAWSGAFWSNEYTAWDQIQFPTNSAEGGWNPGVHLDYRRFFSDSFLNWLRFEASLIRPRAQNPFVYTNWPEVAWSVDIFQAAQLLDATAWDNYGAMPGAANSYEVLRTAFNHDLCRSSRADQLFFVAEQATEPSPDTDSRAIRLITWTDIAHGSRGTIFFEFRPPVEGSEMDYVSMLEPDRSYGYSTPVLQQTFQEIARIYPQLASARTEADIAIVYDYENSWDQGFRIREGNNIGAGYDNVATRYYTGVKSLKRNVDVIPESRDFARYRMIVAPGLRMLSDETADRLNRWVKNGGVLILDRKAGIRTADGRLRPLIEPGVFSALAGIKVPAMEQAHDPQSVQFLGQEEDYAVADSEFIIMESAEPLARFHRGALAGKSAVTLHSAGRGFVVYVAFTSRQDAFFDALFSILGARFQFEPLCPAPREVDVVSRTANGRSFLFLLNNSTTPAQIALPRPCTELISGRPVTGAFEVGPLDIAIFTNEG